MPTRQDMRADRDIHIFKGASTVASFLTISLKVAKFLQIKNKASCNASIYYVCRLL